MVLESIGLSAMVRSAALRNATISLRKNKRGGQGEMGEVIGRRGLNGTMRRRQCAPEGIRPDVEPVCVLVPVHHRQRGPAAGLIRRILNGPLQSVSRLRMLLGSDAFEVPEVAQHRLVRAQLIEGSSFAASR